MRNDGESGSERKQVPKPYCETKERARQRDRETQTERQRERQKMTFEACLSQKRGQKMYTYISYSFTMIQPIHKSGKTRTHSVEHVLPPG